MLEAAAAEDVDRLVMLSSARAIPTATGLKEEPGMFAGDPPAAGSESAGCTAISRSSSNGIAGTARIGAATALRPTLIYGPHDDFKPESAHFVPSFIHRVVAREKPIEIWGDGIQTRNLIHAADVASAVIAALRAGKGYAAYNVADARSVSVNEVLTTLLEVDGFDDAKGRASSRQGGRRSALEVSGAAFGARFGWAPSMSLRAGLADTLDWYRRTRS